VINMGNKKFSLRPKWMGRKKTGNSTIGEVGYISPDERKRLKRVGMTVLIATVTTFITAIIMSFVMGRLIVADEDIIYWFNRPFHVQTLITTMVPFAVAIVISLLTNGGLLFLYLRAYYNKK